MAKRKQVLQNSSLLGDTRAYSQKGIQRLGTTLPERLRVVNQSRENSRGFGYQVSSFHWPPLISSWASSVKLSKRQRAAPIQNEDVRETRLSPDWRKNMEGGREDPLWYVVFNQSAAVQSCLRGHPPALPPPIGVETLNDITCLEIHSAEPTGWPLQHNFT